jgi:hypothetical protein
MDQSDKHFSLFNMATIMTVKVLQDGSLVLNHVYLAVSQLSLPSTSFLCTHIQIILSIEQIHKIGFHCKGLSRKK